MSAGMTTVGLSALARDARHLHKLDLEPAHAEATLASPDLLVHRPMVSTGRTDFDGGNPHGDEVRWHEGHPRWAKGDLLSR
jgi:hypothetical protein